MKDLTIRDCQIFQPWTVPYSGGLYLAANHVPHIFASHAVLHAAKTVGKLAAVFESLDHSGDDAPSPEQLQALKDAAPDLLAAALRLANLYGFDLADELERRVEDKNGVAMRDLIPIRKE